MNVISIPLDKIVIGQRLRAVDEVYAQMIAASIEADGQRTPIEVGKRDRKGMYGLISGAHRLRALEIAGRADALAVELDKSERDAQRYEIEENLIRRELSKLDRAVFLSRWKELYEAENSEVRHGGDRREASSKISNLIVERFSKAAAERIGIGEDTVQDGVTLAKKLSHQARAIIQGSWLADHNSELKALSKLPRDEQLPVAELIMASGEKELRVGPAYRQFKALPAPAVPDLADKIIDWLDHKCDPEQRERVRAYLNRSSRRNAA